MRKEPRALLGCLGVAALTLTGCSAGAGATAASDPTSPITVATIPLSDDPSAENPIDVFGELLSEQTGREVEITDVPDYLSVVEAVRAGHVDIGLMSGFPSALAVNTGEVDALVAFEGTDEPVSTCVVLQESPITTVEDLRGATVAFADPASSSGYFMPVFMLHQAGLEKDVDYEAIFAGGHEGSFVALAEGQVDAACTAVILTKMGEPYFPFAEGEWRGVGESPSMPLVGAVLGRTDLDRATRTQLMEALPVVFDASNKEALGAIGDFAGRPVLVDPEPSAFSGFVEIADVAGVTLEDLDR